MKKLLIVAAALLLPAAAAAMQQSQIPAKFPIPWGSSAGSSYIRSIPQGSQIGIQNCAASLTDGFPPLTFTPAAAGGCAPFGQDLNGALNQVTLWSRWQGAGAQSAYDSTFSATVGGYPIGAILTKAGAPGFYWVSLVDNNASNPDTGGAGWAPLGARSAVVAVVGASTTFTNQQIGTTVPRSNSGAVMTDTLPGTGPGVITAGGLITVYNADATALLAVSAGSGAAIKNLANFTALGTVILGPGQSGIFQSDGSNYYPISIPDRTKLGANTTVFIATTGSDSNTGLAVGSPLLTRQFAYNAWQRVVDLAGFTLTFQIANGTYTDPMLVHGPFVGMTSVASVTFQGNTGTPSNVVVNPPGGGNNVPFWALDGARFEINGVRTQSGTNQVIADGASSVVWLANHEINASSSGSPIAATRHGEIQFVGNLIFDNVTNGNGWDALSGGVIAVPPGATVQVTFNGAPNFTTAFSTTENGSFWINGTMTFVGSFTGTRFTNTLNGVTNTGTGNINFFPGTVAGSNTLGGQYN